jgi:hypothetical protein
MTGSGALVLGPLAVSLVIIALTWPTLERLASRKGAFWHLKEMPRTGPPAVPSNQRPMESPEVTQRNAHFMYLDRRPQRERLLPTYLAPPTPPRIPSWAIIAWGAASALLAGAAGATVAIASRVPPAILSGLLAMWFGATATRGLLHNTRLRPARDVADKLYEEASAALLRARQLIERGEPATARALLETTADTLHDLAPASGDPPRLLGLAQELRAAGKAIIEEARG